MSSCTDFLGRYRIIASITNRRTLIPSERSHHFSSSRRSTWENCITEKEREVIECNLNVFSITLAYLSGLSLQSHLWDDSDDRKSRTQAARKCQRNSAKCFCLLTSRLCSKEMASTETLRVATGYRYYILNFKLFYCKMYKIKPTKFFTTSRISMRGVQKVILQSL